MRVSIIPEQKVGSLLPRLGGSNAVCYFLSDNYVSFLRARERFNGKIDIKNLSGLFDKLTEELKPLIIDSLSRLNVRRDSFEWWGGHVASRSSSATPLILNIVYLFCAKKILKDSKIDIIFVTQSIALGNCIAVHAKECGFEVLDYRRGSVGLETAKRYARYIGQAVYFVKLVLNERSAALKFFSPLPAKKTLGRKRVVIRSWVTDSNFDKTGKFSDRNFGCLPQWLGSKGYEVWTLPIFFNISMTPKELFALLKKQNNFFLFPVQYLTFGDYAEALRGAWKLCRTPVKDVLVAGTDIAPLVNEVLARGIYVYLLFYNLCCPMLKRLKEKGYEIDGFYYPFESNAPEKLFILSCRKYFPEAEVIGFQHTSFYSNQFAYSLGAYEKDCHPLPDKIICSGPAYRKLYMQEGFPPEILTDGVNLRYKSVHKEVRKKTSFSSEKKILLLPLSFNCDCAFELLEKVYRATKDHSDYQVYVRTYFLLSKKKLFGFLGEIGANNYLLADEGVIQDWFLKAHAVITTGGSVTTLEAASFGTPVIRVIPDNTFHMDALVCPDYPLKPVRTPAEIQTQLAEIDDIINGQNNVFGDIATRTLERYFKEPAEENLKVFLLSEHTKKSERDRVAR